MITIELLNQMAIADGEVPFDMGALNDFEPNELHTESANGDTTSPRALVAFAREIDQHLRLPEISSQAEQRLEAFIHNYRMEIAEDIEETAQIKKRAFFDLTQFLPNNFFSFGSLINGRNIALPAGGTFALAACAVLFFAIQGTATQDWESRYAEIAGASRINEVYEIGASTSFFEKPTMAMRGQKIDRVSEDLANYRVSNYIENDIGLDNLVPSLRATQAQGLIAAKIPEHQLWLIFRGSLNAVPSAKLSDEKTQCYLVEAIISEKLVPPSNEKGAFLGYCPQEWTKKLSLL